MAEKDYKLTQLERETIITFNEAEKTAHVFSLSKSWMSRIQKMEGAKPCGEGWEIEVPKSWIKFPKEPKKVVLSAEQKRVLAERCKKMAGARAKK